MVPIQAGSKNLQHVSKSVCEGHVCLESICHKHSKGIQQSSHFGSYLQQRTKPVASANKKPRGVKAVKKWCRHKNTYAPFGWTSGVQIDNQILTCTYVTSSLIIVASHTYASLAILGRSGIQIGNQNFIFSYFLEGATSFLFAGASHCFIRERLINLGGTSLPSRTKTRGHHFRSCPHGNSKLQNLRQSRLARSIGRRSRGDFTQIHRREREARPQSVRCRGQKSA